MAERSGINMWMIRGYELARREPDWKGVRSLANALNVAAEVFSEWDESAMDEQSARLREGRKSEALADLVADP